MKKIASLALAILIAAGSVTTSQAYPNKIATKANYVVQKASFVKKAAKVVIPAAAIVAAAIVADKDANNGQVTAATLELLTKAEIKEALKVTGTKLFALGAIYVYSILIYAVILSIYRLKGTNGDGC